jgi:hypothetical protein
MKRGPARLEPGQALTSGDGTAPSKRGDALGGEAA